MPDDRKSEATSSLGDLLRSSVERLCAAVEARGRASDLLAIGFVTSDAARSLAAFLRFAGDLPLQAEAYKLLSPVEWSHSDDQSFEELNRYLAAVRASREESDADYRIRVRRLVDACADGVEALGLRQRFGDDLFLTFCGVDPNETLEAEERRFVQRLNPAASENPLTPFLTENPLTPFLGDPSW
jgi:hypothetical protein